MKSEGSTKDLLQTPTVPQSQSRPQEGKKEYSCISDSTSKEQPKDIENLKLHRTKEGKEKPKKTPEKIKSEGKAPI